MRQPCALRIIGQVVGGTAADTTRRRAPTSEIRILGAAPVDHDLRGVDAPEGDALRDEWNARQHQVEEALRAARAAIEGADAGPDRAEALGLLAAVARVLRGLRAMIPASVAPEAPSGGIFARALDGAYASCARVIAQVEARTDGTRREGPSLPRVHVVVHGWDGVAAPLRHDEHAHTTFVVWTPEVRPAGLLRDLGIVERAALDRDLI